MKLSLRSYLILIFTVSILLAVMFSSVIMAQRITENSKNRLIEGDQWLVSQLCKNAEYLSSQAENLSATLAFDSDIQSALIEYQYGINPGLEQIRIQINNNLLYQSRFNAALYDCRNIVLFSNDGEVLGSKETFHQNQKISDYEWFDLVKDSHGKSIWLPLDYDVFSKSTRSVLTIPIVRKIFSTQSSKENSLNETMTVGKELGYVIVYINVDMFSNLVAKDSDVYTKYFFLVDENNRIISSQDKTQIGQPFVSVKQKNGYIRYQDAEYLMTEKKIENRGWTYLCLADKEEVMREASIVISVCTIIAIILMLVFAVVGLLISKNIGEPVTVLVQNFKRAENGNVSIAEKTNIIEFENLYASFNQTMDNIHNLVNEIYENRLLHQELVTNIKESQIRALQMQINPHFLYNTLDCINWKAQMDGNKDVAEMIRILGKFFRSNTEAKGEFTTLKDEIENIELYISLSKLRFGSRLHCFLDIDETLNSYQVIKLLLQPLIENSIKYTLEREGTDETIWVWCGQEDKDVVISIKDDGNGIEADTLENLRMLWNCMSEGFVRTESIGIYNVMRRLYLCYKENCNFELFSEKGQGTEIVITFPMILQRI